MLGYKIKIDLNPISDEMVNLVIQQASGIFGIEDSLASEFFIKRGVLENHAYKTDGGGLRS